MARSTNVRNAILVTFELEGASERPFSNSEYYVFPPATADVTLRAQATWLAFARACCLPDQIVIDKVRATKDDDPTQHIILNREPIEGKYTTALSLLTVSGADDNVILSGNGTPDSNNSMVVPDGADLQISDPVVAMNFYMEGESWQRIDRQFNCLPDVVVHNLRAEGLADNFAWLSATPPTIDTSVLPTPSGNFYINLRRFFDGLRAFCKISGNDKANSGARILSDLTNVIFRGIGKKAVGAPRKKYRGRAPISS